MKKLHSKAFNTVLKDLTDFVNRNNLRQNDIQITPYIVGPFHISHFILWYWSERELV